MGQTGKKQSHTDKHAGKQCPRQCIGGYLGPDALGFFFQLILLRAHGKHSEQGPSIVKWERRVRGKDPKPLTASFSNKSHILRARSWSFHSGTPQEPNPSHRPVIKMIIFSHPSQPISNPSPSPEDPSCHPAWKSPSQYLMLRSQVEKGSLTTFKFQVLGSQLALPRMHF